MAATSTPRISSSGPDPVNLPHPVYYRLRAPLWTPARIILRHRHPSLTAAAAVAGDDAGANSACSQRNIDQLDQLLAGLSELRIKQRQGLVDDAKHEGQWDEFEEGEEGIDWVWWRSSDDDQAAAPDSFHLDSNAATTTTSSPLSSQQHSQQQQQPPQQQSDQQQSPPQAVRSTPATHSGPGSSTAAGSSGSISSRRVRRSRNVAA